MSYKIYFHSKSIYLNIYKLARCPAQIARLANFCILPSLILKFYAYIHLYWHKTAESFPVMTTIYVLLLRYGHLL